MRLIWHISAKDLRRMRLPLGLWLLLVASQVLLAFALSRGFGFDLQVPNRGEYMVTFDELRLLGYVLGIADLVLTYCLMGHLVQIDKVVGQDAFWMTRPISGPRLLASKLLTAVLVFGILPALVWSPLWIYSGYQLSSLGAAALEIGCLHLCLLPVAFALAALTDTLGRFELWSFVVAIAAIIVPASLKLAIPRWTSHPMGSGAECPSILFATCWIVIGCLYFTRRRMLATVFATTGVLLALGSLFITAAPAGKPRALPSTSASLAARPSLRLNAAARVINADSDPQVSFRLTAVLTPPPKELTLWSLQDADLRWRSDMSDAAFPAESSSLGSQRPVGVAGLDGLGLPNEVEDEAFGRAFEENFRSHHPDWVGHPALAASTQLYLTQRMAPAAADRLIGHHPSLEGTFWFTTYRLRKVWEIPLLPQSSSLSPDERFRIVSRDILSVKGPKGVYEDRLFVRNTRTRYAPPPSFRLSGLISEFLGMVPIKPDVDTWTVVNKERTQSHAVDLAGRRELSCVLGTTCISWEVTPFSPPPVLTGGKLTHGPLSWFEGASLARLEPVPDRTLSWTFPKTPVEVETKVP